MYCIFVIWRLTLTAKTDAISYKEKKSFLSETICGPFHNTRVHHIAPFSPPDVSGDRESFSAYICVVWFSLHHCLVMPINGCFVTFSFSLWIVCFFSFLVIYQYFILLTMRTLCIELVYSCFWLHSLQKGWSVRQLFWAN